MYKIDIVIGANYGDEGKGQTVNCITENENTLVILTNGGAQRGHTVNYNGITHIFHHFGSGTLKGASSFFADEYILNPIEYLTEYAELSKSVKDLYKKVIVSPLCRVTTPFDMLANLERENLKNTHASCGYGIFETINRYADAKNKFMNIGEFSRDDSTWKDELLKVRDHYLKNKLITKKSSVYEEFMSPALIDNFIIDLYNFFNLINEINLFEYSISDFNHIIFEQGQGLALDNDYDTEFGTPTKTGSTISKKYILKSAQANAEIASINRYYVTRTYLSRHGDGTLPNYDSNLLYEDTTNVPNANQGTIRFANFTIESYEEMKNRIVKDMFILKGFDKIATVENNLVVTHADKATLPVDETVLSVDLKLNNIFYVADKNTSKFDKN